MKGIILAAGAGSRLYPITTCMAKPLLPVYDKPMIYYPMSILMLAGIRDVLIITSPADRFIFERLFGDGSKLGINVTYAVQERQNGIADAFIVGEQFIGNDRVALVLGDNIFYGGDFTSKVTNVMSRNDVTIFGYPVPNPKSFGVVEFDSSFNVLSIEEKPEEPKSNYAVPGLYFYDNDVIEIAKNVQQSARGELEITSVNNEYLKRGKLKIELLSQDTIWMDAGTHKSLLEASKQVEEFQSKYDLYIACLEEIAFRKGYIDKEQLLRLVQPLIKTDYGKHLAKCAKNTCPIMKEYRENRR